MTELEIKVDSRGLRQRMALLRRDQIPFAMALTLNWLTRITIREEEKEIKRVFDRPTPAIRKPFFTPKEGLATPKRQEAFFKFKDKGSTFGQELQNIMSPHIFGGARNEKSTEKRLKQIGVISNNEWMVAAFGAKRDRFGNVPERVYQNLLFWYRGIGESGFNIGTGRQGVRYEIVPEGQGRMIYEVPTFKSGRQLYRPRFFLTKRAPKYKKRFDLYGVLEKSKEKHGPILADRAMIRALKTARPR